MAKKHVILFVCTGNVCRSPMAVGFLQARLAREGRAAEFDVRSAGLWALEGEPATAYARQVMAEHDLDISDHRGRNLTQEDIDQADLILVMAERHANAIQRDFRRADDKMYLLSEMIGQRFDIEDPYGGSLMDYRLKARELEEIIEAGYPKIVDLATKI